MKKKYQHIFFDLDHTLWDFERNSSEVLSQLFDEHELGEIGHFSREAFCEKFKEINYQLWNTYNQKLLSKDHLRTNRFNLIFQALGLHKQEKMAQKLSEEYMSRCPSMPYVFPFTEEVLQYLKNEKKYNLHIITNGFEDVQHIKLNSSRLTPYFQQVITADLAGCQKPDRKIFDFAISRVSCKEDECVMIGDNLEADIIGARNASIDQIFFNPSKASHGETITYEISCLSELLKIL